MRSRGAWLAVWIGAAILAVAALLTVEIHWRRAGYEPTVIDSPQLWSIQRGRVYGKQPIPLVLLGASRTEYGIDPKVLRDALPKYKPVMLALNATYPLATLRDLAADADFSGVVLCDLESFAFTPIFWDMQQPVIDYYRRRWTPSWHLHRVLLTWWQRLALIANPDFGATATVRRLFDGGAPTRNYVEYHASRGGDIDYTKADPEAVKRHFAATVEGNLARMPKPDPDRWLADLQPVFDWVRAIQARGGQVIFYESPTSGLTRQIDERVFPRNQYWDRFTAASPSPVLSARDVPSLASTPLPDDSHIDYRDKPAYTRALAEALIERGWLKR